MEINGIAHIMLTVSDYEACLPFYERLLTFLGMRPVFQMDGYYYCVGGRTAMGIVRAARRCASESALFSKTRSRVNPCLRSNSPTAG